jgi:hypothetical protein
MKLTLARNVLYALVVCSGAHGSVGATEGGAGGETGGSPAGPAAAIRHGREAALAADKIKGDALKPGEPLKSGDTTGRGLNGRNSADPNVQRPAAIGTTGLIPQRGAGIRQPAHDILSRTTAAATRANLLRSPPADHAGNRPDPLTGAARGVGAMTVPIGTYRRFPAGSSAVGRSPASLKALAGNGVIGGARAAGLGSVGGPANGRTVIKASSIDGSALHRRS